MRKLARAFDYDVLGERPALAHWQAGERLGSTNGYSVPRQKQSRGEARAEFEDVPPVHVEAKSL